MRRLWIIIGIIALFPHFANAQAEPATISVSGYGRIEVEPDMATIALGVTRQAKTAGEALAQVAATSRNIFARLADAGIAPRDMQTSNLSLHPLYADRSASVNAAPRIVGYQASNMVTIRVRDMAAVGPILDRIVQSGANQFNGLRFGVQETDDLMDQARALAVADAFHRAEVLAKAAGVDLGPVQSISDLSGGGPAPVMADMAFARSETMPVAGGEVSLSANVSIVFAIGQ